jgi:hypothetical protein
MWTAMPPTLPSTTSHSPVCSPARSSIPSRRTPSLIAQAQRTRGRRAVERGEEAVVHHRADVIHARLEIGNTGDTVGHARPALIEADQPASRREALEQRRLRRHAPRELDVRDERRDVDDVIGALAHDLVGDRDVAALCVPHFGLLHAPTV